MKKELNKYFAAREATDRWMSEISDPIKEIGRRYIAAMMDAGHSERLSDIPDHIKTISRYADLIKISGERYSRGCSDHAWFEIPSVFLFGTDDEQNSAWAELETSATSYQEKRKLAEIEAARIHYEKLLKDL